MKRLALALTLLLVSCVTIEPQPPIDNAQTPYEYVCEQVTNINPAYTCEGMTEPVVVISHVVSDHRLNLFGGLRGIFYPGENYVFVKADMSADDTYTVTVHELAHLVLYANGVGMEQEQRCLQEQLARFIAGQKADEWRERYGCVKEN